MNEPRCPYCGEMMNLNDNGSMFHDGKATAWWYECGPNLCNACGPVSYEGPEQALEETLRRPVQKPMSFEELVKANSVWLEDYDKKTCVLALVGHVVDEEVKLYIRYGRDWIKTQWVQIGEYGKRWRAWYACPTDEERAAAPWEV